MTTPVRLAKRLAETVPCSRREAELYIAGGWVTVDGEVVEEPQFMVAEQKVELLPNAKLVPIKPVTILLHQPPDADADAVQKLIRPDTQSADDRSGIHTIKQHFARLKPCLPLEPHAGGLTVFTQDYKVARKLADEAAPVEQEYIVEVAGEMAADGLSLLNRGLSFNGRKLPPGKVSWQNEFRLRFALNSVQPGQLAYMCESVGLQVVAIKRIRIGRLPMAKLQPGQWRYLKPYERF